MKRVYLYAMMFALVSLSACRQSDMRTAEIRVPQVTNAACETRVRNAIGKLKGIDMKTLAFDRDAATLTVRYESMILAMKNIEHAIIAAGFDANELTATDAARAALPTACTGEAATSNAPPAAVGP